MEEQQIMDTKIKAFICERGCDIDQGQQPQTFKTSAKSTSNEHEIFDQNSRITDHCVSDEISLSSESGLETAENSENRFSNNHDGSPPFKKLAVESQTGNSSRPSTVFQPREHTIEVRNCSQLSKSLKDFIVNSVVQALLKKDESKNEDSGESEERLTSTGKPLRKWTKGGTMLLAEVAKLFDKDTLKKLKNECGGIQTLLRNHRYLFKGMIRYINIYFHITNQKNLRCLSRNGLHQPIVSTNQ